MLHVIVGCMFAGKTESIIQISRKYRAIDKKVLIVNHSLDSRYSDQHVVMSHNGTREECLKIDKLENVEYNDFDVIIIEEAQFFPDLLEFFEKCDLVSKIFVVSGLAADFNMKPIGDILLLISRADMVDKINGFCQECKDGTVGPFTKRVNTIDKSVIAIGSNDIYKCVCRRHYYTTE
jgi:thymidine kinase